MNEESAFPTNNIGGGNIAQPTGKAFGARVIDVDCDTFHKCKAGKEKFQRWKRYVEDPEFREQLKSQFSKKGPVLLRNKIGLMAYLKK